MKVSFDYFRERERDDREAATEAVPGHGQDAHLTLVDEDASKIAPKRTIHPSWLLRPLNGAIRS